MFLFSWLDIEYLEYKLKYFLNLELINCYMSVKTANIGCLCTVNPLKVFFSVSCSFVDCWGCDDDTNFLVFSKQALCILYIWHFCFHWVFVDYITNRTKLECFRWLMTLIFTHKSNVSCETLKDTMVRTWSSINCFKSVYILIYCTTIKHWL